MSPPLSHPHFYDVSFTAAAHLPSLTENRQLVVETASFTLTKIEIRK